MTDDRSAPPRDRLPYVRYECRLATFRPEVRYPVRWLAWEDDYELASTIWPDESPLTRETWRQAREGGYRYCGAGEQRLLAIAAVWRYSERAWEAAAVRTQPDVRRRGYAKAVVSHVTAHILDSGRRATCTTGADNVAMQRTAESVGFYRIDQE